MKNRISVMALCLLMVGGAYAQNEEEELIVTPSGRILMDGGLFDAGKENNLFNDGFAIPDMRISMKAKYGKWAAKVDVGYAYGKVGMKDTQLQYTFDNKNFIRGGYFIHQYGLQSATSSSFKESMEEPRSNQAFNNDRMLGVMFVHSAKKFLGTVSLFNENDAMKMSSDHLGNQATGAMSRLVYRPFTAPGTIFHVGISGAYEAPRYNENADLDHSSYVLKTSWPTRVAKVTALEATVSNAKGLYKFTPEVVGAIGRFGFGAQYFMNYIKRDKGFENFIGSGAYGEVRAIIKGGDYTYNYCDGGLATPNVGSMEVVLAYDYTDLSDCKAKVWGGMSNDYSATFNYYFNKYMIWRIRASYSNVTNRLDYTVPENHMSTIETRLQIKF